jgi:hypothetical protein
LRQGLIEQPAKGRRFAWYSRGAGQVSTANQMGWSGAFFVVLHLVEEVDLLVEE